MGRRDLKKQKVTRKFNGETYAMTGTSSGRKTDAQKKAKNLRKRGIRARVVKTKSYGYTPYFNIKDEQHARKKR
jgi:hypothetical protein